MVDREYTDRGELYRLKHASTVIDTRGYDDGGRMTSSAYNNGVSESRSYGSDNTLSSISFTGASIGNLSYGWDDNKNKTAETIAGTMSGYGFNVGSSGYDNEDRLVNFNRTDGNLDQSWSLTSVGDWNSVTTEGTAQSRTHGPTHELTAVAGSSVSTDVKGNITLIPTAARPNAQSLLLNWDFDNRLSTADVGNNSSVDVTYKFDALGRRVYRQDSSSTTVYVQAGQQTIADYVSGTAASSPTYRYVYASYIDEPVFRYKPTGSESIYFHRNQQYSVVALTNGSGSIVERYAYSAYGVPTIADSSGSVLTSSAYSNRYTYTGREWDPVLLMYHYRARMYDANLGRFCSRDPIGFVARQYTIYGYVKARPMVAVDPGGYMSALPAGPPPEVWIPRVAPGTDVVPRVPIGPTCRFVAGRACIYITVFVVSEQLGESIAVETTVPICEDITYWICDNGQADPIPKRGPIPDTDPESSPKPDEDDEDEERKRTCEDIFGPSVPRCPAGGVTSNRLAACRLCNGDPDWSPDNGRPSHREYFFPGAKHYNCLQKCTKKIGWGLVCGQCCDDKSGIAEVKEMCTCQFKGR